MNIKPLESLPELLAAIESFGSAHYGEAVTQEQHMLQCATLAEREGAPDSLIVAALLHDIGHSLRVNAVARPETDFHHEVAGARMLTKLFADTITTPIQLHVAAKRYLCAIDRSYFEGLSDASVHSLELQGGPMTEEQCQRFRNAEYFEEAIALRRYDDLGKDIGADVPPLQYFVPLMEKMLKSSN